MIHSKQYTKLKKLAAREHVSIAEIKRRAIDAYHPDISIDNELLEELLDAVIQSTKEATKAVEETRQEIKKTVDNLARNRERRKRGFNSHG